jgi:glyceraldehyde 3-phosphate dehydrogenase
MAEKKVQIGINGFGRIGRITGRVIMEQYSDWLEVVAINDIAPVEFNAALLKHDTNYGKFPKEVSTRIGPANEPWLVVDGKDLRVYQQRNPADIPWRDHGVDIVIESTGLFTDKAKAQAHIDGGGAKKVIISAPAKGGAKTIVLGVNECAYDPAVDHVISNASCTTNCLAPMAKAIDELWGIEHGFMTTIHSYTNDQRVADQVHPDDLRRARAAAANMIPTSTGAARAIGEVLPNLKGKLDGIAIRVPTTTVSITDLVVTTKQSLCDNPDDPDARKAAVKAVKAALKAKANEPYLGVTEEELVSSDFRGDIRSSIIDLAQTNVIGSNMLKVCSWYDNEWGYSCRLAELAKYVAERL